MRHEGSSWLQDHETLKDEYVPFDLIDEKGRTVGVQISIDRHEYVPHTDETRAKGSWGVNPGVYYIARVQPTRNTKRFGTRSEKWLSTYEQAEEQVRKATAASRKRYTKKYGVPWNFKL